MSKVMTLGTPADLPTRAPPTTPPAGPEWQMRAGTWLADWADMTPPPEWVTSTSPS